MSYLNAHGLQSLWDKISSIFTRKTQAVGSGSLNGTTLYLTAVSGGTLSTIPLGTFATDSEAAHNLTASGATLTLTNVNGQTLATVDLSGAINSAISSGTSGLITETTANARYGTGFYVGNDGTLWLMNRNSAALDSVDGIVWNDTAQLRYAQGLALNGSTLQLLNGNGGVIDSVVLP